MKTIIIYECEYCSGRSCNPEEIRKCEEAHRRAGEWVSSMNEHTNVLNLTLNDNVNLTLNQDDVKKYVADILSATSSIVSVVQQEASRRQQKED